MNTKKNTNTKAAPKRKASKKKTIFQKKSADFFRLGTLFFILGTIGLGYELWQSFQRGVEYILPENTAYFFEISPTEIPEKLQSQDFFLPESPKKLLGDIKLEEVTPWIGNKIAFGQIESDLFLAAKVRSKKSAENFLAQQFLVAEESFQKQEAEGGDYYIPEFSGGITFAFKDGWIVAGYDESVIKDILNTEKTLHESEEKALSNTDGFFRGFGKSNAFVKDEKNNAQPLYETLTEIAPGFIIWSESRSDESIKTQVKVNIKPDALLSHDKPQKPVIPELARFTDDQALLFVNGVDLFKQYQHTKDFFEKIDPQLAIVFDGILQTEGQNIFGPKFDFSADFLSKAHGQYALILDFSDPLLPFPKGLLITGFGKSDTKQKLEDFHDTLRFAQGKFRTKIETVELPNGRTREEIVAADPSEILIEEVETVNGNFYTAKNQDTDTSMSYGFLENYFLFSTHQELVQKAFLRDFSALTENTDFRNMVLLSKDPADSYGSVNISKLSALLEQSGVSEEGGLNLFQNFKTLFFSRKNNPNYLEVDFILR